MSVIRAMREESETIKFDNLFTNDLEQEQEFDLIFGAEQDDEDLKTIAGNAIIKEDGNEIVTNIPDCIAVNEDGEVVDKDDEAESSDEEPVEDLSDSDKDDDGVADDVEAVVAKDQADPSVVVNVDADNVNINAADPGVDAKGVAESEGESEAEHNNVGMTINADTVNMTVGANAPTDAAPAATAEPATAPVEVQDTETEVLDIEDKDGNNVPDEVDDAIEDAKAETQAPEEPATAEEDNANATPNTDDNGEPTATAESGMEDIYTASQLEDILNTGLEPAPAPQNTTPENEPVDPSTEVIFSDTGDQEVQEAAEPSKDDPVAFLTEEDGVIDIEDAEPVDSADIKQNTDISPIGPDKVIPDEVNAPDEDIDYDKAAQEKRVEEAAEPSKDDPVDFLTEADGVIEDLDEEAADIPAVKNDENLDNAADIEGDFNDDEKQVTDANVEKIMNDAPEDETKEEEGIDPVKPEDVPMNDGTAHEAAEPSKDDPVDFLTEEDGIIDDITLGIAPTDDSEGIIQVEEPKHTDTSANSAIAGTNTDEVEDAAETVEDLELPAQEAAEPSKDDPVDFLTEADGVIEDLDEASEPMDPKEETTEQDAEDSLITMDPSLTGGDLISMYVEKPDDPDKKNDGKLAEAANPSKDDPVDFLTEADGVIEDLDEEAADIPAVKNDENLDNAADIEKDFNDDEKQVVDADVEKIMNDAPEDSTKEEEGIDPVKPEDVPMNDGTAHESADFITEADGSIDIEEQINAEDNGDSFIDVMNNGLSTTPEEVDPTSEDAVADELIDDEIIDLIEAE